MSCRLSFHVVKTTVFRVDNLSDFLIIQIECQKLYLRFQLACDYLVKEHSV